MPRYRRYRRGYPIARSLRTNKYSNETYIFNNANTIYTTTGNYRVGMIPPTSVMGTRKIKNFTLSLSTVPLVPFLFALVFVPEGTAPSILKLPTGDTPESLYEPNQNVIMSGMFGGPNATISRFKSKLARNLNSGDNIYLIVKPIQDYDTGAPITAVLNYAVAF